MNSLTDAMVVTLEILGKPEGASGIEGALDIEEVFVGSSDGEVDVDGMDDGGDDTVGFVFNHCERGEG